MFKICSEFAINYYWIFDCANRETTLTNTRSHSVRFRFSLASTSHILVNHCKYSHFKHWLIFTKYSNLAFYNIYYDTYSKVRLNCIICCSKVWFKLPFSRLYAYILSQKKLCFIYCWFSFVFITNTENTVLNNNL